MPDDQTGPPAAGADDPFNLDERAARFGERVIRFCKELPPEVIAEPLIRQIVRSATSIGANYCGADGAVARKEFRRKIGTCKKEARETKHWPRMLAAVPSQAEPARLPWRESHELHLIFAAIYRKLADASPWQR